MKPDTVRVRIAVAVDGGGLWSAAGNCAYETDQETADAAADYLPVEASLNRHIVWVEADVPLPAQQVVKGTVQSDNGD